MVIAYRSEYFAFAKKKCEDQQNAAKLCALVTDILSLMILI